MLISKPMPALASHFQLYNTVSIKDLSSILLLLPTSPAPAAPLPSASSQNHPHTPYPTSSHARTYNTKIQPPSIKLPPSPILFSTNPPYPSQRTSADQQQRHPYSVRVPSASYFATSLQSSRCLSCVLVFGRPWRGRQCNLCS
jgi:hypothetical protein